jgi:predicted  nucleic acid-binding Zn-ribbon protein
MDEADKPRGNPLLTQKIFMKARVAALREELSGLLAERKELLEKLRSAADKEAKGHKALKVRKVYLDQRPPQIREEIERLTDERAEIERRMRDTAQVQR